MLILVVNAGSSSLKYQLIDMDDEKVIQREIVTESESTVISPIKHSTEEYLTRIARSLLIRKPLKSLPILF